MSNFQAARAFFSGFVFAAVICGIVIFESRMQRVCSVSRTNCGNGQLQS